jgi:hypothetical protein
MDWMTSTLYMWVGMIDLDKPRRGGISVAPGFNRGLRKCTNKIGRGSLCDKWKIFLRPEQLYPPTP